MQKKTECPIISYLHLQDTWLLINVMGWSSKPHGFTLASICLTLIVLRCQYRFRQVNPMYDRIRLTQYYMMGPIGTYIEP